MGNKIRVLYAENNKLTVELVRTALEEAGIAVRVMPNGKRAWEVYQREAPDILLLDLNMPLWNGVEVTRLVRAVDPRIPILIYTSHGEVENEFEALEAGVSAFVPKERPLEVLVAYLKKLYREIEAKINAPHVYHLSPVTTYNASAQTLTRENDTKRLPLNEARLLQLFCAKSNQFIDLDYIVTGVWDKRTIGKEKEVKKYVCGLRHSLGGDPDISIEYREINGVKGYILLLRV